MFFNKREISNYNQLEEVLGNSNLPKFEYDLFDNCIKEYDVTDQIVSNNTKDVKAILRKFRKSTKDKESIELVNIILKDYTLLKKFVLINDGSYLMSTMLIKNNELCSTIDLFTIQEIYDIELKNGVYNYISEKQWLKIMKKHSDNIYLNMSVINDRKSTLLSPYCLGLDFETGPIMDFPLSLYERTPCINRYGSKSIVGIIKDTTI